TVPEPIECLRDPDHQALHRAGEPRATHGVDDHVDVVVLHAELDQAEAFLRLAAPEAALEHPVRPWRPQARQATTDPEHDVRRSHDLRSSRVRHSRAATLTTIRGLHVPLLSSSSDRSPRTPRRTRSTTVSVRSRNICRASRAIETRVSA